MGWTDTFDFSSPNRFNFKAEAPEVTKATGLRRWKPYLPSTWKWFRTSGSAKVYELNPPKGVTHEVSFSLPSWMRKYVVDESGGTYPGFGNISPTLDGSSGDYIKLGNRTTVFMTTHGWGYNPDGAEPTTYTPYWAVESGSLPHAPPFNVTFPTLEFQTEGETYHLDWQKFASDKTIQSGSDGQGWGFPSAGKPTYGEASMHDTTLAMTWGTRYAWWWLLLLIPIAILGIGIIRKNK